MLFNSIKGVKWKQQPGVEREVANRVQLDVRAAIPERQAPPPTVGEPLPRRQNIRRSVEVARYGYTDRCIGCQHARLGLKPADHSEECRARIVRHMTTDERTRDSLRTVTLSLQDATAQRSNVMRLAYLSADRIEVQFASEELPRAMAEPATAVVEELKRCIRFLLKYPRCSQSFEREEIVPKQITCNSDSNFAGCLQSRKSTSSCNIFYGEHLLKSTSTTQAVVSLSSAEAEFYAAVKAAAAGIGCVSMMRDLGVILQHEGVNV